MRAPSLSLPWVSVVAIAAVAAVFVWLMVGRSEGTSRWTRDSAETSLQQSKWDDHRIVLGTRCLALDPVEQGSGATASTAASRFDCQVVYATRPSTVGEAQWDEMGDAIRSNNVRHAAELLQLPANASAAEVQAASSRWGLDGSRSISDVVGIKAVSATRWKHRSPQFSPSTFAQADQLRSRLLGAIPAVEAFYVDHKTYAAITVAGLRAIDPNVSDQIAFPQANDATYCAQITDGQITWSERGPGGAPLPHACT
jgi:hypothetical protein